MVQSRHGGWKLSLWCWNLPFLREKERRKEKEKTRGPACIIHYQQSKKDCNVQQISEGNFKKINEAAAVRKTTTKQQRKKHKAMKVKGWITFVARYRTCMKITPGVTRTLWTPAELFWNKRTHQKRRVMFLSGLIWILCSQRLSENRLMVC